MPNVTKLRLKSQKAIPLDICQKLFEQIEQNPTYKPIINTLFHTGLRIGETNGFDWDDLHFFDKNPFFDVNKAITVEYDVDEEGTPGASRTVRGLPKSESSVRCVPMDHVVKDILLEWRNHHNHHNQKGTSPVRQSSFLVMNGFTADILRP